MERDGLRRILATFAEWLQPPVGHMGELASHVYFSDDNGMTWTEAQYEGGISLYAPVYPGFNGCNHGAIEGTITETSLDTIRIYMRTQAGYLYQSISHDLGLTWLAASPSPFKSSSSPACAIKLRDNRILLLWSNQPQLPLMTTGQGTIGLYSGRDSLHGAISDDGGDSWKGFREVYVNPKRNESPGPGDIGASYPCAVQLNDGSVFLAAGQGDTTGMLRFDPDWLCETTRSDDFSGGLASWSTYTAYDFEHVSPGLGRKAPRTEGASLVDHPERIGAKALHVRKAYPDRAADGANWNFPSGNGKRGTVTIVLKLNEGFQGAGISLADAFYDPWYSDGEKQAVFLLRISHDGSVEGGGRLVVGQWNRITLAWSLESEECRVTAENGDVLTVLKPNVPQVGGTPICYLHLKSMADEGTIDTSGFLVQSVTADTN
ncbi:exo-alpha-sialidase [Paenibacillus mesophilus]|uniref:sialidase family protein n=1 Tax=Paenibacillus mesophilus TaxID=2582849 RepID=UPI00110D60AE|nr:sialidase family protein [Paenibacillus mesophilus]TMV48755.1 exo-alpha-sialidase [Paenibacillus mesophilus]